MTPLRRQNIFKMLWRVIYPVGIHFCIGQIVGSVVLMWLMAHVTDAETAYSRYIVTLTGITGLLVMIPCALFYRKDRRNRIIGGLISIDREKSGIPEILLLFLTGAGFAQYVNLFVGILQSYFNYTAYSESMERMTNGKSLVILILWRGIVAPIAEEMIFRWLIYLRLRDHLGIITSGVISAGIFGIYHGNWAQGLYAFIMGMIFAYLLEMGGNLWVSIFLHAGANIWVLVFGQYARSLLDKFGPGSIAMIYGISVAAMITGYRYFVHKGKRRGCRAI